MVVEVQLSELAEVGTGVPEKGSRLGRRPSYTLLALNAAEELPPLRQEWKTQTQSSSYATGPRAWCHGQCSAAGVSDEKWHLGNAEQEGRKKRQEAFCKVQ